MICVTCGGSGNVITPGPEAISKRFRVCPDCKGFGTSDVFGSGKIVYDHARMEKNVRKAKLLAKTKGILTGKD